ncbi:MAG: AfsR/SARP family transcriptional regulator [Caldilineaceae bacterium]
MDGHSATTLPSISPTYSLTITLFGSFQVTLNDKPIVDIRSNKARALLAYLVLAQSKPIARASLTDLLWPGYMATSARTNLRHELSKLRKILAPLALLQGDYQTVQLLVDRTVSIACDALQFDQLFDACQHHDHPSIAACPACHKRLRQATALYQGAFLAHFPPVDSPAFTAWLQAQQTRYAERFAQSVALLQSSQEVARTPPLAVVEQRTARPTTPNNLPFQLTSFIGREAAIAELTDWLTAASEAQPQTAPRLITLTGAGGVGKTRLALQVAARVLPAFGAGIWFIELAALADPTLLPATVATVLGVRPEAARPLLTTLGEWVQDKQLLLVLDNGEHLLDACAHLADALLRASATLCILVMSREALGVVGELHYEVAPLAFPLATASPLTVATLAEYEAVRLFLARAALVQPKFRLTNANAPAIAQLCQRLDGMPLALELAAAQVKALPVETIVDRLEQRFELLVSGNRAALPRHQTLRALIDWSYDLLSAPDRVLLRRLAVFAGGWTLAAAEAICADPSLDPAHTVAHTGAPAGLAATAVLTWLTRLVAQSLVSVDEQGDAPRYRLLETIREYGIEKLQAANEDDALRARHLHFFLTVAEASETGLLAGNQRAHWLHRLTLEHDNLQAALTWACLHDPALASRLAGLLRWYWNLSGQITIAEQWYQRVLAIYNPTPLTHARALALLGRGMIPTDLVSWQAARLLLAESISAWQAMDEPEKLSEAYSFLLFVMLGSSEAEAVCTLCAQQEALLRATTAPYTLAHILIFWGRALFLARQDFAAAQRLHEEALQLGQQTQDPLVLAKTYQYLGHMTLQQGDYAAAQRHYLEALAWRRQGGVPLLIGAALYNAADLLALQGDKGAAHALYQEAVALLRPLGMRYSFAYLLGRVGALAVALGDEQQASAIFAECVAVYRMRGLQAGVDQIVLCAAERLGQQGQAALAVRLLAVKTLQHSYTLNDILYQRALAAARLQLSPTAFATAWAAGQATTLDAALALALPALLPALDAARLITL